MLRDRGVVHDLDPFLGERRADVERDPRVVRRQLEHALADRGELVLGGPAVGRQRGLARLDLLAQAGDADLEELVEVAREDREELDPLEQRVALVACLVQHARVEFQPRQLAIDVRERGLRTCRPSRTPNLRSRDGSGLDGSHAVRLCSSGGLRHAGGWADHGRARIARVVERSAHHDHRSARYRRSPDAASTHTCMDTPVVGSTKRSAVGLKRGSSGWSSGSPPPGPGRLRADFGGHRAVAPSLEEDRRHDHESGHDRPQPRQPRPSSERRSRRSRRG